MPKPWHPIPLTRLGLQPLFPLLTSTATVTYAISEVIFFTPFLSTSVSPLAISKWWDIAIYPSLPWVVGLVGGSSLSGLIVGQWYSASSARSFYRYGALFAVSHFAFVPVISKVIKRMVYGPEEEVKDNQKKWLKIHAVRTLLTDIPALVCYGLAILKGSYFRPTNH